MNSSQIQFKVLRMRLSALAGIAICLQTPIIAVAQSVTELQSDKTFKSE